MKIFLFILLLFITNCTTTNKTTYMCGERECLNKKEAKEYFEKNLSLEVKIIKEKKEKNFDLVKLNTNPINQNKKKESISLDEKKILKIKKKQEKEEIKKQKKLAKLQIKKEKARLKEERKIIHSDNKLLKSKKKKERKPKVKKITKSKKTKKKQKITKKENKFCIIPEKCDIDEISEYLIKIGKEKDYPDIAKN